VGKRVFILDDEPDLVDLLRTILEKEGYEVECETDARRGLARLLDETPDLLLLDLMMPGVDGFEVLKLLRQDFISPRMPILILSARTGTEDQIQSLQLGADAYLCKPFSPKELIAEIGKLLNGAGVSA